MFVLLIINFLLQKKHFVDLYDKSVNTKKLFLTNLRTLSDFIKVRKSRKTGNGRDSEIPGGRTEPSGK